MFAIPLWANTQVLWYRKSLADAAGLDMSQPVTWDQVIKAASDNNGSVGVQANKYEAYVVLIGVGHELAPDLGREPGQALLDHAPPAAGKLLRVRRHLLEGAQAVQHMVGVDRLHRRRVLDPCRAEQRCGHAAVPVRVRIAISGGQAKRTGTFETPTPPLT